MKAAIPVVVLLLALVACTSVQVRKIDDSRFKLVHICIQENPRVQIDDFVQVLRDGFERHGISTEVYAENGARPSTCEYVLTYIARRSWDFAPYLSEATLELRRGNELVSRANYHLVGKGGWDLTKWKGTAAKMNPVIDKMLADY